MARKPLIAALFGDGSPAEPRRLASSPHLVVLLDRVSSCSFCFNWKARGVFKLSGMSGREEDACYICRDCIEPLQTALNILFAEEAL